jgi:hypothetical protein
MSASPQDQAGRPTSPAMDDEQVLLRVRNAQNGDKFRTLFDDGNIAAYHHGNHDHADMGLCSMLAFYTQSAEQLDRLFRRSALMRPYWDARQGTQTYGARTIAHALERTTARWGTRPARPRGSPAPPADADASAVRALALHRALLLTDAMPESHKKTLLWLLERWGLAVGGPLPAEEDLEWQFINYDDADDMADAPCCESSLRRAVDALAERGLFWCRPHISGKTGNPYKDVRPNLGGWCASRRSCWPARWPKGPGASSGARHAAPRASRARSARG